jgi:tRNA-uridine 2-sulfurtransferase
VQGHEHPWLQSAVLSTEQAHWIAGAPPPDASLAAKTRYRQADAACVLRSASGDAFALTFSQPQFAVTPGQSAVVYEGEVCLGGGVIAA